MDGLLSNTLNFVRTVINPLFSRGQVVPGYSIVMSLLIVALVTQFIGRDDVTYPDYGKKLIVGSKNWNLFGVCQERNLSHIYFIFLSFLSRMY